MWLKADWVIRSSFWASLCHSYTKILTRREWKAETWAKWNHVWAHHFQEPTLPQCGSFILECQHTSPSLSFSSSSVTNCIKPLIFFEESLYFSVGGFSSFNPSTAVWGWCSRKHSHRDPSCSAMTSLLSITSFRRIPAESSLGSNKCSSWNLDL